MKRSLFTSLENEVSVSELTGDQAVRTGRSMTQRTFLWGSGEILLYPTESSIYGVFTFYLEL